MLKRIFITIVPLFVLLLNFVVPPVTRAYTGTDSFYNSNHSISNYQGYSFDTNGLLIFHSFYKLSTVLESFPVAERYLDDSYFRSGTWQGQNVSNLSSKYLRDQGDLVSITTSFCSSSGYNYWIYSVITAIPVVAGDNFSLQAGYSDIVDSTGGYLHKSFLPGVTGLKRVHLDKSDFSGSTSPVFSTESENQYLSVLFSADLFDGKSSFTASAADSLCSSFDNSIRIRSNEFASVYTSGFGLPVGSDISFTLKDSVSNWNYQVFEFFTDGIFYPGNFDDNNFNGGGSGGGSTDITPIIDRLDTIIDKLDSGSSAFSPEDFWAVYREGLIELFGLDDNQTDDSEPIEPPPEDSDNSLDSALGSGIDKEQFDKAFEYVETDLGSNISGSTGAISFFWYITDKFLTTTGLYTVVGLSLIFAFVTWLLRS